AHASRHRGHAQNDSTPCTTRPLRRLDPAAARGCCGVDRGAVLEVDEHRAALPDLADLDGLAGAGRVDLLVAAEVDPHVSGGPDDVAHLGLRAGDDLAGVTLAR